MEIRLVLWCLLVEYDFIMYFCFWYSHCNFSNVFQRGNFMQRYVLMALVGYSASAVRALTYPKFGTMGFAEQKGV